MAAAGSPAARCLTVLLTLAVLLGHPGQALGLQRAGAAAVNPPSYEELSSSLVVNQLAIIKMMQDASNATSGMAENEARRQEAAAARDEKFEELLKSLKEDEQRCSQETVEAITASTQATQRLEQALEAGLKAILENVTQEIITSMAENEARRQEAAAARDEKIEEILKRLQEDEQRRSQETVEPITTSTQATQRLENVTQETVTACPDGWLRHESSCYLVDDTFRTWEDSLAYCRGLGGDLAKITSAEEQQFITAHLGSTRCCYWIGLNDRETEGRFVWTDGTAPTYTRWRKGQPDDYGRGEDCVSMYRPDDGKWFDDSCSGGWRPGAVCERPVHA